MSDQAKEEVRQVCVTPDGKWGPQCQSLSEWFSDMAVVKDQLAACQ
jgi:hypothetical protein